MVSLAVDCSNYQGPLSQAQFEAMYRDGVRTVIVGTDGNPTFPLVFDVQAANARAAGMNVEAYIFLYFGSDVVGRTNQKLDMIDLDGHIKRVWLDCEAPNQGLDAGAIVGQIAAARDAVQARGYEAGIYTANWWWPANTGDSTGFTDLKLWTAQYRISRNIDDVTLYGGWTQAYRLQFTDKGSAGGVEPLDLNVERVEVVAGPDDFTRGRADMLAGIKRDLPGVVEAWLDARYSEWGVPR